ncbi:hypothetical protein MSP8887_04391 [Marinomonas spartinae]|nr:hypothetical protein MSP8887_04391 [Marinomonas spartinae]
MLSSKLSQLYLFHKMDCLMLLSVGISTEVNRYD